MIKLPPYSKNLYLSLKKGIKPSNDILLFIGLKCWEKGKSFHNSYPNRVMILPPWESPYIYFWPVKNCSVLIFDTGFADDEYIEEIALSLFSHDSSIVHFVSHDFQFNTFKKE